MNEEADPPRPIGRIIKRAREKRRWSQQEAAAMLGVSRSALNKWENDRAYPRSAIGALEELYGVRLDDEPPRGALVPPELADKLDVVDAVRRRFPDPATQARMLEAMAATVRGDPPPTAEPGETGQPAPSGRERRAG